MKHDHLEILLEDIRDKITIMAEGYDLLHQKIDRLEVNLSEKIDANSQKITAVSEQVGVNTEKLTVLSEQVAVNTEKITVLSEQVAVNTEKLTANSFKIDHLTANLADTRQEVNTRIDRLAADMKAHRDDTEQHRAYTEQHRGYLVAEK